MKTIWILLLLTSAAYAQGPRRGGNFKGKQNQQRQQGPDMAELRETLRFIRLAETKKSLNLSEEKLLQVNQILDEIDDHRFNLKQEERQLKQSLKRAMRNESGEGLAIVDEIVAARQRTAQLEVEMWTKIKATLTDDEAVDFILFFERFQRDVQRRIRMLQNQRRGGMNQKNRNE